MANPAPQPKKPATVLISTSMGDITIMLYDDTPLHRDNFLKLAESGFYNGSVFHRVIRNFMIQGGGAPSGTADVSYTVPAEFNARFIHKKGALAAARMGDQVNPMKASSGSQFYIVQGKAQDDATLDMLAQRNGISYTPEQRNLYKTIGGTPHLDMGYTVFGEVISGLEVVDKIAAVQTAPGDKPLVDVSMTMKIINN
jgi:cyclophilin family peptidyl-prolyl cis-trans isomerase